MKRLFFSIILSTIFFICCETQPNASTSDQEVQKRVENFENRDAQIRELKEYYEEYSISDFMGQSNIQFIVAMKFKNLGASTLSNELCNFLREGRRKKERQ